MRDEIDMSVSLHNISFSYGENVVLQDVNLDVGEGEIVALFGPSGCGKTTILRLTAGLETARSGSIHINDQVMADQGEMVAPEDRPVGFVFQDFALFPHMSVLENTVFGLKGARKDRLIRAGEELLALEMGEFAHRYPHQLSGGQQQRAALARVFARRPHAILLDEPFASVDSVLRHRLRRDLRLLLKERRTPTIIVTHDPEEALEMADRIAVMKQGRIIEDATPAALFESPESPEGASLFPGAQVLLGDVGDEGVTTAFGPIDLSGMTKLHELSEAKIMIVARSGALSAEPDRDGLAVISDVRDLGGSVRYLVSARAPDQASTQPTAPLAVEAPSPLSIGDQVRLRPAPSGVFVFSSAGERLAD